MFAASKGNGLCCSFPAYAKPVGQGFLVYSSVQLVTVKLPEYQNFEAGISCKISSLYNYLKWLMIILTKKKKQTNKQKNSTCNVQTKEDLKTVTLTKP